jgi:hypothetical protein
VKSVSQRDICTSIFIAALFTVTKIWYQCTCPTKDERVKIMWYIYTEYCLALKRRKSGGGGRGEK